MLRTNLDMTDVFLLLLTKVAMRHRRCRIARCSTMVKTNNALPLRKLYGHLRRALPLSHYAKLAFSALPSNARYRAGGMLRRTADFGVCWRRIDGDFKGKFRGFITPCGIAHHINPQLIFAARRQYSTIGIAGACADK